jgi:hypothetical protein
MRDRRVGPRWDNLGFDGPAIVGAFREYEALDSLTQTASGKTNVAYRVADVSQGPAQTIEIHGVDIEGVASAKLALQNWNLHFAGAEPPAYYALNYRVNGGAWKARTLTASELQMMADLPMQARDRCSTSTWLTSSPAPTSSAHDLERGRATRPWCSTSI